MNLTGDQMAGSKQLKALEILLQQNAQLEQEIERLNKELDELTAGVQKKGYLHKWREREIYYASRWGLRYIALQGSKISYYGSEHESHPRRVIDLSNCFVRDEGKKRTGSQVYHIFSIYLRSAIDDEDHDQDSGGNLLLRLSTESSAEAVLWIDMLERACSLSNDSADDTPLVDHNEVIPLESELLMPHEEPSDFQFEITRIESNSRLYNSNNGDDGLDVDTSAVRDQASSLLVDMPLEVPSAMLQRVKSSTEVLQRSRSRTLLPKQSKVTTSRVPSSHTKGSCQLNPSAALTATIALKGSESEVGSSSKDGTAKTKSKAKSFPAYKPMHLQSQPSALSPDTGHGDHNFRGFFNLGVIILALSHVELIINNLYQVGLKVSWLLPRDTAQLHLMSNRMASPTVLYVCLAVSCWFVSFSLSFAVEKAAATYHYLSETVIFVIYVLLITFSIVAPCMFVWHSEEMHVGASMAYLFQSVILWMKLISYAHANHDLRVAIRRAKRLDRDSGKPSLERSDSNSSIRSSDTQDNNAKPYGEQLQLLLAECKDLQPPFVLYPQNITILNLLYFSIAPTLCYQLNYPRSPSIRWTNVIFLLFRLVFVGAMILFSVEQYIFPHLESIVTPMADRNVLRIVEKVLTLSIPNTYIWLLVFYFYFHLWLNLLAELTRFGDRQFYKEWYAATAVAACSSSYLLLLCAMMAICISSSVVTPNALGLDYPSSM